MRIPIISPVYHTIRRGFSKLYYQFKFRNVVSARDFPKTDKIEIERERDTFQYALSLEDLKVANRALSSYSREFYEYLCLMEGSIAFNARADYLKLTGVVYDIAYKSDKFFISHADKDLLNFEKYIAEEIFDKANSYADNCLSEGMILRRKTEIQDTYMGADGDLGFRGRIMAVKRLRDSIAKQEGLLKEKYGKIPKFTWETPKAHEKYDFVWVNPLEEKAKKTPRKEFSDMARPAPGAPVKRKTSIFSKLSPFKVVSPESPYRAPKRAS